MSLAARFSSKIEADPNSGCWLWIGSLSTAGGYARMLGPNRKVVPASHVALILDGRPRPSPQHEAIHRCDTPACVNPAHLRWALHAENVADMIAKGRASDAGLRIFWEMPSERRYRATCRRGHPLSGPNLYVSPRGCRKCATCMREQNRAASAKRSAARRAA
ncbi:hypothetical protein [Phenylobacterium sp.]|uniref:hypothetical protein n=1 Tax=Phenylobacterium sp. TaxID=1871053 RepID=UPI0039515840